MIRRHLLFRPKRRVGSPLLSFHDEFRGIDMFSAGLVRCDASNYVLRQVVLADADDCDIANAAVIRLVALSEAK